MGKSRWSPAFILRRYHLKTNVRFRVAIYAALALFLYLVLIGTVLPERYRLAPGQVSPVTIVAPRSAVDVQATQVARRTVAAAVRPRYDIDPQVEASALAKVSSLFAAVGQFQSAAAQFQNKHVVPLPKLSAAGLTSAEANALLSLDRAQLAAARVDTLNIVKRILGGQFSQSDLARAGLIVDQQLVSLDTGRAARLAIGGIVRSVLRPNLVYDPISTRLARQSAERAVLPIWINKGDVIVRRGQFVTYATIGRLKDLKLLRTQPDYADLGGFLFFVATLTLATATFIQLRRERLARDNVHLLLYASLVGFMSILIAVAHAAIDAGLPPTVLYAVPIAAGSMMVAMFFGTSLAMLTAVLLAVLDTAAFGFAFPPFFAALLGSLAAIMGMTRVHHRRVFVRAGLLAAGANTAAIVIMHFLLSAAGGDWRTLLVAVGFGVAGGLSSTVLTIGVLPYLETFFGVITHMGLLELANPNHPLLRRLLLEAPGTYHHSLIVGNLAEAAAQTVGADALVCRVSAYYHDVGKMNRPMFFVENLMSDENPHDKIAPNLSHFIITAHVSDGLAMLREHRLPEPVRAICAEHHGTTVLWYFYNKAVEEHKRTADENGQPPSADDFRYPGPRPQSKESAIVMVCDAVEASVRAMHQPTPERIEATIRKIIKDRLSDGQLDECDVTLRDLDRMVDAFLYTLKGIYHERIEYPDPAKLLEAQANQ